MTTLNYPAGIKQAAKAGLPVTIDPRAGMINPPITLTPGVDYWNPGYGDWRDKDPGWGGFPDVPVPIGPPIGPGPNWVSPITPQIGNPLNGGNGNPLPIPLPGGGGGGGGGLNIPDWLEDVLEGAGFTWESVGEWLGDLFGNGGTGSSLLDDDEENKTFALEQIFNNRPDVRQAFITFLRNAGAAINFINTFINSPVPNWPVWLINLALFWLEKGAATTPGQNGFAESQGLLQQNTQTGTGTSLPIPMTGFELLAGTAFASPVVAATPTMSYRAPKGYVTVTNPATGQKIWVEKNLAYRSGLKKRRKKAPFTAAEWGTLKTAARVEEKINRVAKTSLRKYKCVRR